MLDTGVLNDLPSLRVSAENHARHEMSNERKEPAGLPELPLQGLACHLHHRLDVHRICDMHVGILQCIGLFIDYLRLSKLFGHESRPFGHTSTMVPQPPPADAGFKQRLHLTPGLRSV